jgi:hypothetical protein
MASVGEIGSEVLERDGSLGHGLRWGGFLGWWHGNLPLANSQ